MDALNHALNNNDVHAVAKLGDTLLKFWAEAKKEQHLVRGEATEHQRVSADVVTRQLKQW